jgi:hypothetical protein
LSAIIKEQQQVEERIKDSLNMAQETYKACSSKRKPESSIVADLELTLAAFNVSCAAYHGCDFNGVCCRRIVRSAKPICDEI